MAKVHIVGAGPAGSVAAISAVRNNFDVIVSEEHPSAGIPENCSGLFSKDGLDSLKDFMDYRKFVINPITGADIYLLDEKLSVEKKFPVGFVCDRAAMDQALALRAEEEGAVINYGERINGSFHSDNIIGADGPLSSVARHFDFRNITQYAATLRATADFKCDNPHKVQVFLSNSLFPGFFGWIIPHSEYTAELGVGVSFPNNVSTAWQKMLRLKKITHTSKPAGHVIPLKTRQRTARRIGKRNVLLAGDAAGQVKSTTGGGVIFGANCAVLAGTYATRPLRYELGWRLRFGSDLAMHKLIHSYISSLSDGTLVSLGKRLKKLDCDGYLSNYGHMDRPIKMIRPEMVTHFLKNIAGGA